MPNGFNQYIPSSKAVLLPAYHVVNQWELTRLYPLILNVGHKKRQGTIFHFPTGQDHPAITPKISFRMERKRNEKSLFLTNSENKDLSDDSGRHRDDRLGISVMQAYCPSYILGI